MTTSDYLIGGLICAGIVILAFMAMWLGWRRRTLRAKTLGVQTVAPHSLAKSHFADVFYIATTSSLNSHERVSVPGLQYRGYADVTVFAEAIEICVRGEKPSYLTKVTQVALGSATIAKAVEPGGIVQIDWTAGTQKLITHLRFTNPRTQQEFIEQVKEHVIREAVTC